MFNLFCLRDFSKYSPADAGSYRHFVSGVKYNISLAALTVRCMLSCCVCALQSVRQAVANAAVI